MIVNKVNEPVTEVNNIPFIEGGQDEINNNKINL